MKIAAMFGSSTGAVAATAVAGVLVVAGAVGYSIVSSQPGGPDRPEPAALLEDAADAAIDAAPEEQPDTTEMAGATDVVTPDAETEVDAPDYAPMLDVVRVEPDGSTLIAGRTAPGLPVAILLDGAEVATVEADGAGDFVAFLTLPAADTPRLISAEARPAGEAVARGPDSVIVAPFALAMAEPTIDAAPAPGEEIPAASETPESGGDAEAPDIASSGPEAAPEADGSAEIAASGEEAEAQVADAPVIVAEDVSGGDMEGAAQPTEIAIATAEETTGAEAGAELEGPSDGDRAPNVGAEDVMAPEAVASAEAEEVASAEVTELGETQEASEPAVQDIAAVSPDASSEPEGGAELSSSSPAGATAPPSSGPALADAGDPGTDTETVAPVAAAPEQDGPQPGDAPAVVIAGPSGVRIAQGGGAPQVQTQVRLDAISYDSTGAVTLAGRGPATADIQVYLNNQPIQLGEVGPNGSWSLELPDVDPGTYDLVVAEMAEDGSVASQVTTPFLREDPERVAEAPVQAEAQGVDVITVQPGFTLWGIAENNFGEGILYVQIFEENRDQIRDPNWIFPGQIFRLPEMEGEAAQN
ncbi:LysM peptidoglycan-binding domain-containing protein [Rhodobacterales bacterium HKCCE4037]|nr:LysM peptidoglycan-binding domain-containing protein [Rhodobacterales bacterium HKCCE4037]